MGRRLLHEMVGPRQESLMGQQIMRVYRELALTESQRESSKHGVASVAVAEVSSQCPMKGNLVGSRDPCHEPAGLSTSRI